MRNPDYILFGHTVPGSAIRTFSQPFRRLAAAFLAGKNGFMLH